MLTKNQLYQVAKLYYEKDKTQQEIADELGVSRIMISRALKSCIDRGIVEIKINYKNAYYDLEQEVKHKFNLAKVRICPSDEEDKVNLAIANKLGEELGELIMNDTYVGVGWGNTLSLLHPEKTSLPNVTFVPLLGGYGNYSYSGHSNQVSANLSECFEAKSLVLNCPAIAVDLDMKKAFLSSFSIQNIFKVYSKLDSAIISLGNPSDSSATIYSSRYFNQQDIDEFSKEKITCDIVSSIYFNNKGEAVDLEVLDRTIGISAKDLRKIPNLIVACGGKKKRETLYFAIKDGIINTLITDEESAKYLLSK